MSKGKGTFYYELYILNFLDEGEYTNSSMIPQNGTELNYMNNSSFDADTKRGGGELITMILSLE